MLSPGFILFTLFVLFAIGFSFWLSFHKWNILEPAKPYVGLANYKQAVHDPDLGKAIINTLFFTSTIPIGLAVGLLFVLFGCALRSWAAGYLLKGKRVAVGGPYAYVRNPLYLGVTLFYLGLSVAAGSCWAIGLVVPLLRVMNTGVITRESRYLERKFGDAYRAYKARVRRWV